jgi:hypothetical protein
MAKCKNKLIITKGQTLVTLSKFFKKFMKRANIFKTLNQKYNILPMRLNTYKQSIENQIVKIVNSNRGNSALMEFYIIGQKSHG